MSKTEQAENFDEVFGTNTDYVIDPEECMADNFGHTLAYGVFHISSLRMKSINSTTEEGRRRLGLSARIRNSFSGG